MAEVDHLYKQKCFEPILVKDLTTQEKIKACDAIMLLTDNNNEYIKGRDLLNGKLSRLWTAKEKIDSPTAVNESIMIIAEIDSK